MKISNQTKNGRALSALLFVIQTVVIGQILKTESLFCSMIRSVKRNLWSFGAENGHLMRRTWRGERKTADNIIEYLCKQESMAVQARQEYENHCM